jgi:hypothetical protein
MTAAILGGEFAQYQCNDEPVCRPIPAIITAKTIPLAKQGGRSRAGVPRISNQIAKKPNKLKLFFRYFNHFAKRPHPLPSTKTDAKSAFLISTIRPIIVRADLNRLSLLSRVAPMQSAVPAIYVMRGPPARLSASERFFAAAISACALALLIVAASLTPNALGLGTHRDLGLAECGFLQKTGLPCPACGMTTSFAWFARGNFIASIYIQPMGALLAAMSAMAVWAGAWIAITGRPAHRLISSFSSRQTFVGLLGFALAAWGWKIFIHLRGIDGW